MNRHFSRIASLKIKTMKTTVVLPAFLLLLSFHPKQEKLIETPSPVAFNAEAEKAAILQTIEDETNSFYRRDYASWKKFWVSGDYAFQGWNNGDGTFDASVGWTAIDKRIADYIKNHPLAQGQTTSHPRVERRNMVIQFLSDDLAYLVWDQYNGDMENKFFTLSKDQRIMKKENGGWKIVNITSFWDYKNKIPMEGFK
jgi:hypothetical protein